MMILSRMPTAREWVTSLLAVSPYVAAGGLAAACAWTAGLALSSGAGIGAFAGLASWLGCWSIVIYRERQVLRVVHEEHDDSRRESAIRRLWQASSDFEPGAWAQQDLERLRFLCLNLEEGTRLNHRISSRLRESASAVLGGVLDRLQDIVIAARESGVAEDEVAELETAGINLGASLDGSVCRAGDVPNLEAEAVAETTGELIERLGVLRKRLRPRIVADTVPILRWLVHAEHEERVEAGRLVLDLEGTDEESRVAIRPFDLVGGVSRMLDLVFRRGQLDGSLEIKGRIEESAYKLHLAWKVRDRWRLEPATVLETMRPLTCYGARLAIEEDLENSRMNVEVWLPWIEEEGAAALGELEAR